MRILLSSLLLGLAVWHSHASPYRVDYEIPNAQVSIIHGGGSLNRARHTSSDESNSRSYDLPALTNRRNRYKLPSNPAVKTSSSKVTYRSRDSSVDNELEVIVRPATDDRRAETVDDLVSTTTTEALKSDDEVKIQVDEAEVKQVEINIKTMLSKDGKVLEGIDVEMKVDGETMQSDTKEALSELMAILKEAKLEGHELDTTQKKSDTADVVAEPESIIDATEDMEKRISSTDMKHGTGSTLFDLALEQGALTQADITVIESFVGEALGNEPSLITKTEVPAVENPAEAVETDKMLEATTDASEKETAALPAEAPVATEESSLSASTDVDLRMAELADMIDGALRSTQTDAELAEVVELIRQELGAATKTELEIIQGDQVIGLTENAEAKAEAASEATMNTEEPAAADIVA